MYFGALVGEYYFCRIQYTDMEHIKYINFSCIGVHHPCVFLQTSAINIGFGVQIARMDADMQQ
jgi:hypothetical protein